MTRRSGGAARRLGNVGRFNNSQTVAKNVQGLAAAALLRHAGFKTVLQALTQYRLACSVGTISVAPTEAFKLEATKSWLFKQ